MILIFGIGFYLIMGLIVSLTLLFFNRKYQPNDPITPHEFMSYFFLWPIVIGMILVFVIAYVMVRIFTRLYV